MAENSNGGGNLAYLGGMIMPSRGNTEEPAKPSRLLVDIRMVREVLAGIPQYDLPLTYKIRSYRPGDAEVWIRIHLASERYHAITRELYEKHFDRDDVLLRDRQLFLCAGDGTEIGTATAWFNNDYHGRPYGRVHWVAIIPSHQGRGLAKPLLTAVCNRLLELGHTRAYLTTETARLPAIHLYQGFGFVPDIQNAKDLAAWRELATQGMKIPGLPETVA